MTKSVLIAVCLLGSVLAACSKRGRVADVVYDLSSTPDGGASNSGDGGGGCMTGTVNAECRTDADCDDGNPATIDTCQLGSGEFPTGTCLHAACDGGASCVNQAVDPTCLNADLGDVYPPYVALYPPDVPASCNSGFQLTDAKSTLSYTVLAKTAAGSQALTLDLDIATYEESDGVQITGVDGNCKKYTLYDTCHLKTADSSERTYTDGMQRPSDTAIRQYHLMLRAGTSQLTFNFGNVRSPMYVQVLGLCDFTLTTPPVGSETWFAPVP